MTRKTTRPTDPLTTAAMTQPLPRMTIPEQIEMFKKTVADLELVHEKSAVAVESARATAEELVRVMAQAKQTIADIQHAIAGLRAVGG